MCGIFGIALKPGATLAKKEFKALLGRLYSLSESRGKESTGLCLYLPQMAQAWTVKSAQPASKALRSKPFKDSLKNGLTSAYGRQTASVSQAVIAIAHSRLVTNGKAELQDNNQPVRWKDINIVHNGIIVNTDKLWAEHSHLTRHAEVDTEVLAALLSDNMTRNFNPVAATQQVFSELKGSASVAWVHESIAGLTLASNTGDLLYAMLPGDAGMVFASERYILEQALTSLVYGKMDIVLPVQPVLANTGVFFDLSNNKTAQLFTLSEQDEQAAHLPVENELTITHNLLSNPAKKAIKPIIGQADESLLHYNEQAMRELKRCSNCILPETFPFIHFDKEGCCNYCRHYTPKYKGVDTAKSKADFIQMAQQFRGNNGRPDVLVPFSGGRDSCYGLHVIKEEFGLNPVTFTYDWGMVTDLARRNIARVCGKLGVQNILVSADIKMKRDNIRKNVSAWLRKPDLGMVPLFMAGDKHFFKIANTIKRQTGIRLDLWSANPLENTDFKSGFCGTSPDFEKARIDYQSLSRKLKMIGYYASRFLVNPAYINSSLIDTAKAFSSYYFEPRRDFFFMFEHMVWDEREVNKVIMDQYDFEMSPDSPSTWRIGDGTAPFYNYIYMTARGFTEFDTFRSNQIREGQITRADALEAVLVENRPRIQSLRWYLDTLNLDFNDAIKRINRLDTAGMHQ